MRLDLAQSLLLQAAEPVFRRLNQDRQSAPRTLQPIFDHLREHLFDPELSVASLRRACGLRDNGISSQFKGHTGLGIRAYFSQRRFTVAAQLLRVSEMSVSLVGELVGFASLTSFSSAFQKWSGCRPLEYRRQHQGKKPVHGPLVASECRAPELKESALRRALLGTLKQERAWALQAHLEDQYGAAPKVPVWKGKVAPLNEDRDLVLNQGRELEEPARALALWQELQNAPLQEARDLLRRTAFQNPCLVHLLIRRSRRWIVEVLLQRALVRAVMKDPQGSYSDLQTVAGLVDAVKEPEQAMRMYDQVSLLLAASQQWAAALEQLTLARQQAARLGRPALERVLAERMRVMGERVAAT